MNLLHGRDAGATEVQNRDKIYRGERHRYAVRKRKLARNKTANTASEHKYSKGTCSVGNCPG
jgi:hypothetical protein